MPDVKAIFVKKNPDGTIVVKLPDGGTRVLPGTALKASAAPKDSGADALRQEIERNDKAKATAKKNTFDDVVLDAYPTAFGQGLAAMVGGKADPLLSVPVATLGGMSGEALREIVGPAMYHDPARIAALPGGHTPEHPSGWRSYYDVTNEAAGNVLNEGLAQGATEMGSKVAGGMFRKIGEMLGLDKAAASKALAESGKGVQLTPGEAGGGAAIKAAEEYVPHLPGAMGPMKTFEEKRAAQTAAELARQLDAVSARGLSKEATGQEVAKVVDAGLKRDATEAANAAYNPLKKPLGLPETATRDEIKRAARAAAKKGNTKPLADLMKADRMYADTRVAMSKRLLKGLADANKPEAVSALVQKSTLRELRTLKDALPPQTMQAVSRNILEDVFAGAQNAKTGEYDAAKIMTGLKALDKDGPKTAMLFGKQAPVIQDSIKQIASIQHNLKLGGLRGSLHAYAVPAAIATTALTMVGTTLAGHPQIAGAEAATIVAAMGGARALAWLMTNPDTALATLAALRTIAQGGIKLIPAAVDTAQGYTQTMPVNTAADLRQANINAPLAAGGGR